MKYIITESRIKDLIKDWFNINFTGKVEEVTSADILSDYFNECGSYTYINRRIDKFGPMYLIDMSDKVKILYQKNLDNGKDWIITNDCIPLDESYFMDLLGIEPLGLTMEQFIEIYL
jgi:hypothetical protein